MFVSSLESKHLNQINIPTTLLNQKFTFSFVAKNTRIKMHEKCTVKVYYSLHIQDAVEQLSNIIKMIKKYT